MAPTSTPKPKLEASVIAARKAAARRLADEADDARVNALIAERGVDIDDHPADEEAAARASELAAEKAAAVEAAATAAGIPIPAPSGELRNARREQLTEWRRLRAVHADMAANPDAYGGVDLGGSPIDVDAQTRMVAEYDNAIAVLEAELG